jgi:hypothetical protein
VQHVSTCNGLCVQAEKEERERRRIEALAAKRYPIDDLELLTEELTAAAFATAANGNVPGTSAAAAAAADEASKALLLAPEQLDVPGLSDAKHLAPEQSAELGQLLYVADTLSQFARQLGVKGCSSSELQATLQAAGAAEEAEGGAQRAKEAQRWLGHAYQQLLKVCRGLAAGRCCALCSAARQAGLQGQTASTGSMQRFCCCASSGSMVRRCTSLLLFIWLRSLLLVSLLLVHPGS